MTGEAYRAAGVDIDAANEAKRRIADQARSTFTSGVLGDIGGFGSLFRPTGYRDPVLVSHIDNVGTKLRIAALMGRYDTVGEDLVNHCVNDILTCGAAPLFFLDYIGMGEISPATAEALMSGMVRACREIGCALVGGETAELPGLYRPGNLDLVGFVVGAVERDRLIDGESVRAGDTLLGVPSSGLHTNGFSLVRRLFNIDDNPAVLAESFPGLDANLGETLLTPHRGYVRVLEPVMDRLKAMAHITGGGLLENVPRVLPDGLGARFDTATWTPPAIFRLVREWGEIGDREMFRVFNMGVGMVLAVARDDVPAVLEAIPDAWVAGEVISVEGSERVTLA